MGKAMGLGSVIGRAGTGAFWPLQNSMVGPQMGMNQNIGMNMNNPNMGMNMNMNPNMGMGRGVSTNGIPLWH